MTRLGFVINLDSCLDQRGCMTNCKKQWNTPMGIYYTETFTAMGGTYPDPIGYFIPVLCQHCGNPTCVSACPEHIFAKREDGIVTVGDTEKCKSCETRPCLEACPYDVIGFDPVTGEVGKCDMCASLVDKGKMPACAATCLTHSWFFGDLDDPGSEVSQIIGAWAGHVHQLKPESGNAPAVYYLLSRREWKDMDGLYSPAWQN